MGITNPKISLLRVKQGYRIEQQRPPAGMILRTMRLDEALQQIPQVLPICGEAQRIAAQRAIGAARGQREHAGDTLLRDGSLLREQLLSSIWRLTVDWPSLLGEARDMLAMKTAMRTSETGELQQQLASLLGGLAAVETMSALREWIDGNSVTAARLVRAAAAAERAAAKGSELNAVELETTPRNAPTAALSICLEDGFWPGHDTPVSLPAREVGALAMARHPLSKRLMEDFGLLAARLLAQALDAAFLATASQQSATLSGPALQRPGNAGDDAVCTGLGWAITARGPLIHRVVLAEPVAEQAVRWDVLAPTDWHFAQDGPVASALKENSTGADWVRLFVAGFDPCAAWSVTDQQGNG